MRNIVELDPYSRIKNEDPLWIQIANTDYTDPWIWIDWQICIKPERAGFRDPDPDPVHCWCIQFKLKYGLKFRPQILTPMYFEHKY